MDRTITEKGIEKFEKHLIFQEKAEATVKKYVLAVRKLSSFLKEKELTKERLIAWRNSMERSLKAATVNGILSAVNAWLAFTGKNELKVKLLKVQRQVFISEERELGVSDYKRLLKAAGEAGKERLYMVMLTLAGTGIRISELKFITVENIRAGRADIHMKGKCRTILLPKKLRKKLLKYAGKMKIVSGILFRTKSGRPLDRSNICHELKKICTQAGVKPSKVFPHNFRHLFARTFYAMEKDLSHLADILGHSSIETTRIYVAASMEVHEKMLEKMDLIL